ncbi:hypothetical protein CG51_12905 [Haematobacter missouriensis]|nr:hypothetical protein CG51_12905 [Haematobacter missouriensis]
MAGARPKPSRWRPSTGWGLPPSRSIRWTASPAGSDRWSGLRRPSCATLASFCWMSRPARSTLPIRRGFWQRCAALPPRGGRSSPCCTIWPLRRNGRTAW